jgi:cytochrome c oxidase assembly protein Cox11
MRFIYLYLLCLAFGATIASANKAQKLDTQREHFKRKSSSVIVRFYTELNKSVPISVKAEKLAKREEVGAKTNSYFTVTNMSKGDVDFALDLKVEPVEAVSYVINKGSIQKRWSLASRASVKVPVEILIGSDLPDSVDVISITLQSRN